MHNLSFVQNETSAQIFENTSLLEEDAMDCGLQPHEYLEVKFFLISVVGSVIGLFGLFGNVSTALILTRPTMRNPNNLYLTALAVFDSCLLITAFFIYAMEYIIEYTQHFQLYVAWLTYLRFAFALSHISQTGSVYITVTVTIERYIAVCYPKRSKTCCSSGGAAWTILGVTTFAVLFNATKFFELEVTRNPDCGDGTDWQSYILLPSQMAQNEIYLQVYALWVTNIVMVFFPFMCLLILNSIIAYTIKKSLEKFDYSDPKIQACLLSSGPMIDYVWRVKDRSELKEKSREATLVLVTIVFIFLICNFWGFVLTLLEQIVDTDTLRRENAAFYTFSREAINFLAIINSSINFVIYILFGKDFRKELIVVYGCGMRGMTLSLPVQDKFSIWRTWTKRGFDLRRSFSYIQRRDKSRRSSCSGREERSTNEGGDRNRFIPVVDSNGHLTANDSPIKCLVNGRHREEASVGLLSGYPDPDEYRTKSTVVTLEGGDTVRETVYHGGTMC